MDLGTIQYNVEANTTDLDKANQSFDKMADAAEKAGEEVDAAGKKFSGAGKESKKFGEDTKTASAGVSGFGRSAGQAGIQIQQLVGQIQGGQSAFLALSAQATDLGIVLGAPLVGVVVGLGSALLGSLAPSLLKAEDSAEKLIETMERIDGVATITKSGVLALSDSIQELAQKSEIAARAQIVVALADAEKAATQAAQSIATAFDKIDAGIGVSGISDFTEPFEKFNQLSDNYISTANELGQSFGLIGSSATDAGFKVMNLLRDLREAPSTENFDKFQNSVSELAVAGGTANKEFLTVVGELQKYFSSAATAAEKTEYLKKAMDDLSGAVEQSGESTSKSTDESTRFIQNLERQIAVMKLSGDALAKELALQSGATGLKRTYIEQLINEKIALEQKAEADKKAQQLADEANRKEEQRAQSIEKMTEQLAKEAALMGNTSKEAEIRYGLSNGLIQAYGAEADALIRNALAVDIAKAKQQEYNDLISELDAAGWEDSFSMPKMEDADFNKLIEGVNNFGGAWSNSGSIIIDTFGSIADITDDYMLQLEELAKKEKNLQIARENTNGDPARIAEVAKAEKKLAQDRAKANISSYRSIAGAASEMFSEQSKGRKALHAVEMSLAAVELAMSAKKMVASAAAGAAKFFEQSGWAGFAGVSAMIATIGAIGGSLGGGGGSGPSAADIQESQGTGTVLGSNDKSASITNSFENFSDIAFDQLVELRGIRENLAKFEGGIAQLSLGISASGLAEQKYVNFADQNVGMIINQGLITRGSRSQDIAGRQMLAPLQGQISDIFEFINDSINSATGALEIAQANPAWAFLTDIGKVSFQDMSGEEIQAELNAIFSQQADLITEFVVPSMKEYQQMGEGLFETLTRVAKEQAIFNDYMDKMGLSMAGVSSLMAIDMAQSIAGLMGGFENFTDKASEYVDKFFTDEEKFGMLQKSLTETFGALNVSMPDSLMGFRSLVEGIDRTTIEGQRLFASLLEISPAFADYVEQMDEMKSATEDMASSAADAANKIAQSAFNMMQSAINAEKKRIQDIVSGAGSAKSALDKAVAAEKSTLKTAYDERIAEIKALADAEKVAQDAINKARIDSLNDERDAVQDRISALSGLFDDLNRSIFDIALKSDELTRARRNAASFEIDTALANARAGRGLPMEGQLSQALDILRDNPSSLYATAEEMAFETAKLQNKLTELAGLTGDQLSRDEKSLLALDAQIASAEASSKFYETATTKYDEMIEQATKQYEADVAAQDAILAKAQEQYDALTGIDTKTLSVEAALIKYNESLLAADFENAQGQYERLDSILSTGQSQLNALLSIDDRILSVNDAVGKFIESINAAQSDQTNKEMLAQMQRMADEIAQLREEQRSQAFAQQKALNTTAKNTTELVYS